MQLISNSISNLNTSDRSYLDRVNTPIIFYEPTETDLINSSNSELIVRNPNETSTKWEKLKKAGVIVKWIVNIVLYTGPVCLVFFLLSLPKGIGPGAISAVVNAPVAALFFNDFFEKILANFNPRRVNIPFFLFSITGFPAGILTGITGLQVATDAIKKNLPSIFHPYAQLVFFCYSLTTRSVGCPLAMHELSEFLLRRWYGRLKPVYQFLNDLEANFMLSDVQQIRATSYEGFVTQFYDTLKNKNIKPGKHPTFILYKILEKLAQIATLIFSQHYFNLFQQLSAEGWSKINNDLAEKCELITSTAVPTQIFINRLACMFPSTLVRTLRDSYIRARYYMGGDKLKKGLITTGAVAVALGSLVLAYYTGDGMAEEEERYEFAALNHTLSICVNQPNLSPFNFGDFLNQQLMTLFAGLLCNGTGTLLFLGNYVLRNTVPKYSALDVLYKMEGSTMLNWSAFEKEFGTKIVDNIQRSRKNCIEAIEESRSNQARRCWHNNLCPSLKILCFWKPSKEGTDREPVLSESNTSSTSSESDNELTRHLM